MSDVDKVYCRKLVQEALRGAGISEPPVSPERIAEHLRIPFRTYHLPSWFSAALIFEDGLPVILTNSASPAEVRTAGVAHVLGHLLLALDGAPRAFPRAESDHAVADFIAGEMVMPAFMVREQACKWFNDYRYLSGLFGVSEVRMYEAMRGLGLVKNKGVIWDY